MCIIAYPHFFKYAGYFSIKKMHCLEFIRQSLPKIKEEKGIIKVMQSRKEDQPGG